MVLNNRMMAYVEGHIYGGKWNEYKDRFEDKQGTFHRSEHQYIKQKAGAKPLLLSFYQSKNPAQPIA
jgi:hypothetical protein